MATEDAEKKKRAMDVKSIPFSAVTLLFHDMRSIRSKRRGSGLESVPKSEQKRGKLRQFWMMVAEKCCYSRDMFANRQSDEVIRPAQMLAPDDAFTLISLLLPELDSAHPYFAMKEAKLADAFVKSLDLIPGSDNAEWLKHYKDKHYRPEKWKLSSEIIDGSLPTVLKAVLKGRCPTESSLTIGDVWDSLDTLASLSNVGTGISNPNYNSGALKIHELSDKEIRNMRADAIRKVIQGGTTEDVAEFSRILLKDTEIRLSQDEFFNWFHPSAKQHYNQTHDMKKLILECHDPNFELGAASVALNRYASVLLTQRPSRKNLKSICENLCGEGDKKGRKGDTANSSAREASQFLTGADKASKYFVVEPKLDGERMELHMEKKYDENGELADVSIMTYSRRGNNSSELYANALREIVSSSVRADAIILDGEIMIWDLIRDAWLPFSQFRDVTVGISKNRVPEGSAYMLKFMVFDVLYVNQRAKKLPSEQKPASGRAPHEVIRLPLHLRRRILQGVLRRREHNNFPGLKSCIEIVSAERGQTEQDFLSALQKYCSAGYEGVIAKNPDKPYAIGGRNADIAVKLKPDYFDGGMSDIDVVILGAKLSTSYSRAGRAGGISTFLIGARDDTARNTGEAPVEGCWVPVGSVGSGYSDLELERIREQLKDHWLNFDAKNLPPHFVRRNYPKTMFKDVVKWIPPSNSIIVTIRAYELVREQTALRFPRADRINWSKPVQEAITVQELEILDEEKTPAIVRPDNTDGDDPAARESSRMAGRNQEWNSAEAAAIAHAKSEGALVTGGRSARKATSGANVDDVTVVSSAFKGLSFYVVGGDRALKDRMEIMIFELGGKFVQNLTDYVDYVVGFDPKYPTLSRYLSRFKADPDGSLARPVVRPSWVERCRETCMKADLRWPDLYFAPANMKGRLLQFADEFGDPWKEDTTAEQLKESIGAISRLREEGNGSDLPEIDNNDLAEELLQSAMRDGGAVLNGTTIYAPEDLSHYPTGAVLLTKMMGGHVVSDVGADMGAASKVLVHAKCESEWQTKARRIDVGRSLEVVTDEWVRSFLK